MVASRAQSLTPKFLYIPHTSDFPIEIQSRMSPPFFHTLAPIYLARLELSLGSTFSDTSKNCSSVYLGRKSFLNLDCKGLDSLLISLQVANTLAFFISNSYCFFCWPTLTLPYSVPQYLQSLILVVISVLLQWHVIALTTNTRRNHIFSDVYCRCHGVLYQGRFIRRCLLYISCQVSNYG
jgi:hypothetical protein